MAANTFPHGPLVKNARLRRCRVAAIVPVKTTVVLRGIKLACPYNGVVTIARSAFAGCDRRQFASLPCSNNVPRFDADARVDGFRLLSSVFDIQTAIIICALFSSPYALKCLSRERAFYIRMAGTPACSSFFFFRFFL